MEPQPANTPQDDDLALIRRVAVKDHLAFEALYHRYYRQLSGYLLTLLKRREIVQEVIDNVMFVVWQDAPSFKNTSRLSTWIFSIAHAYCKALHGLAEISDKLPEMPAATQKLFDREHSHDAMIRREGRSILATALDALPPEQRATVELTHRHGFSYAEIAEITGCSVDMVKMQQFQAGKFLEQRLPTLGLQQRRRS